jgi:CheY-like chemotaxis protein
MQAEREVLLERERQASRLKDEFLAAVSHELRTPLNAILGWLQVLSTTPPSEQTLVKALASVRRNAHAQNRVIEDLLDVSRIITGKLELQLAAIDLRAVIESALETMAPTATAKTIHIDSSMPPIACMVHGDYDRLRQIAWNLLSNAVKFTAPGGAIQLRLIPAMDNVVLSVTDTGIGIAAPFLPYVFDRFRQADGSTTRQFGGLGLGLAIVKELTDLHGGTIEVRSEGEGKGSTFILTLPRFVDRPHIDVAAATVEPLPRLDGVEVLAVDDNLDALEVASAALSEVGASVRQALSADDAMTLWQLAPSDVVLCDLAMPFADGFELLRRLRLTDVAGASVPVIAVTAYASEHYRQGCLDAGFRAHVAKPYDTAELIRTVARAVERTLP